MDDIQLNRNSVINVDIPCFERVTGESGKEHTAYKIVISKAGGIHEIKKRYSEFHRLYNVLNKTNQLPRNIEFPPRITLPHVSKSVKEDRRKKLKVFLQDLCDCNPIAQELLDFFMISRPIQSNLVNSSLSETFSSSEDLLDARKRYKHQPLLTFTQEPFFSGEKNYMKSNSFDDVEKKSVADDVVLSAVFDVFYEDSVKYNQTLIVIE